MNYFDIIIGAILLYAAYKGFSKGIVIQAASLIALIFGIYGAIKFSGLTAAFLVEEFELTTEYLSLISFAITFVGIVIIVHLIARIIDKLVKAVALGFVNRIAGLAFSVLKMAFIISVVLVIINNFNKKYDFLPQDKVEGSVLYKPLSNFAPYLFPYLNFDEIKDSLEDQFDIPKKEEESKPEGVET